MQGRACSCEPLDQCVSDLILNRKLLIWVHRVEVSIFVKQAAATLGWNTSTESHRVGQVRRPTRIAEGTLGVEPVFLFPELHQALCEEFTNRLRSAEPVTQVIVGVVQGCVENVAHSPISVKTRIFCTS